MSGSSDVYTGGNCHCSYCLAPFFRTQVILFVKGTDGKDYTFCNYQTSPGQLQINAEDAASCERRFDIEGALRHEYPYRGTPHLMYFGEAPSDEPSNPRLRDPYAGMSLLQRIIGGPLFFR
jgi:hypothetical protein